MKNLARPDANPVDNISLPSKIAAIKDMWQTDVSLWVIAQETGLSESGVQYYVRKFGFRRSAKYDRLGWHSWSPSPRQAAWLRAHWSDGTSSAEMEAVTGVDESTIRRWGNRTGLGLRDPNATVRKQWSQSGRPELAKRIIAMRKEDTSNTVIAEILGISNRVVDHVLEAARQAGEVFPAQRRPPVRFTSDDVSSLQAGFRFGVGCKMLAALLAQNGLCVTDRNISDFGIRTQIVHRNGRYPILRLLAPEMMWTYAEITWNDPVDLVQRIYQTSHTLTPKLAVRACRDYHAAMERFPQIPALCSNYRSPFWFRKYRILREPLSDLDTYREAVLAPCGAKGARGK